MDTPQFAHDDDAKGSLLFLQATIVGDLPLGYRLQEFAEQVERDPGGSLEIAKRLVPLYLRSLTLKQIDDLEVQNEVLRPAKVFGLGWKPMMAVMELAKNVPTNKAVELILFARQHRKNELKEDLELEEFESRLKKCCVNALNPSEAAQLEKSSGSASQGREQLEGVSSQQAEGDDNPEGCVGENTQFQT